MPKVEYKFNPGSFMIEKVKVTFKDWIKRALSVTAAGIAFGAVFTYAAYNFIDSPKEKMMKREIEQYKLQYQITNDRLNLITASLRDLQDRDDNIYRVIFEAEPIPSSIRKGGYGGADKYSQLMGFSNSDIIIQTSRKLDEITSQLYVQSKSFDEVFNMAKNKETMLASIPAIQPISNKDLKRLSSYFGYRTDPIYKVQKFHNGLDFTAPTGTKVYTTGDGTVAEVIKSRSGFGNTIVIDHGFGYQTHYCHLSRFNVTQGQQVKRGQVIGYVGNSGKSTAPHLHYILCKNGRPINPIYFFFNDLTPGQFEQIIELSQRPSQTMD
ncbi:MAG: M23 family metallopeptidase [Bacteroidetes bacterium]|nr:M23 family metallopeptidase [Bacteroidota bacterium]